MKKLVYFIFTLIALTTCNNMCAMKRRAKRYTNLVLKHKNNPQMKRFALNRLQNQSKNQSNLREYHGSVEDPSLPYATPRNNDLDTAENPSGVVDEILESLSNDPDIDDLDILDDREEDLKQANITADTELPEDDKIQPMYIDSLPTGC